MAQFRNTLAAAVFFLATIPAANALNKDGYYDASDNPLLGTWLLSAEVINPTYTVHCTTERMAFTPANAEYFGEGGGHFLGRALFLPRGAKSLTIIHLESSTVMNSGNATYIFLDHDHILEDAIPRCTWQRGALNGSTALIDAHHAAASPAALAPLPTLTNITPQNDASPAFNCVDLQISLAEFNKAVEDAKEQLKQKSGVQ